MGGRHENLCVCGPSGTGKSHFWEALSQSAVDRGMTVAWVSIEDLGTLVRRHRVDDSVTKAITRIMRADLITVDLCGTWNLPTRARGWVGDPCGGGLRAVVTGTGLGIVTRPVARTGGDRSS